MKELVNVVIPPLAQPFTYESPEHSALTIGTKVIVPLGAQKNVSGFVIEKTVEVPTRGAVKKVKEIVGKGPFFQSEQLEFFKWVAEYYGEPLSKVIDVAIPHFAPAKANRVITLTDVDYSSVKGKLQQAIISHLKNCGGTASFETIARSFPRSSAALKALVQKNIVGITQTDVVVGNEAAMAPSWAKRDVILNEQQQSIVRKLISAIESKRFESHLLYGVTGSGKTEVYIEAIREALQKGEGAIVIVPEIALTPQLVSRFQARLGSSIAILHSGLNKRSRWDSWQELLSGKKMVAIGARSAIFAPVKKLGIVVVDEEHDGSFKQQEGLRYNARDIAIVRAKLASCPVVLGSATPSLESVHRVKEKKMGLVTLPERHSSGSKVSVEILDLNKIKAWEMPSKNISPALFSAIDETLKRKEQVFLLYNRRGFAHYLQCEKCEHVLVCPNCSVTCTYHQFNNSLICHYCFYKSSPPTFCKHCDTSERKEPGTYVLRGSGTEKTQEEVQALFPNAKVLRLDRDVVSDLSSYERILDAVRAGECDVLVGTQMIAKGHDLPTVTLAAVIDCDVGLHMPDFRAGERVFQLLTQLAGRAGRGTKPGKVLLQTRVPKHVSIVCASKNNFDAFASSELETRKELHYPPYFRLLRIVFSSSNEELLLPEAGIVRGMIEKISEVKNLSFSILGPAPCPLAKLKTEYRWHILIKSEKAKHLVSLVTMLREYRSKRRGVKVIFDLDPYDML